MVMMWETDGVHVNATALYGQHVDLRLFVMPGDRVIVNGEYGTVRNVRVYRVGARNRPRTAVVRSDWDALVISTDRGDRWFGYPPRTLPRIPVTRKRPLW